MRGVIAVFALCACDRVYGLTGRVEPVDDAHDDGTIAVDRSPAHDEDGDSIDDFDDNCPGLANVDQLDDDDDDVGDVCDPLGGIPSRPNHRLVFDSFASMSPEWIASSPWEASNDSIGPAANAPVPPSGTFLLREDVQLVMGSPFQIDVAIELPANPPDLRFVGSRLVDVGQQSVWQCSMYYQDGVWHLTAGANAVDAPAGSPIVIRNFGTGAASTVNVCSVLTGKGTQVMLDPQPYPLRVQLWAQTDVRFAFIDVIQ